MPEPSKVKIRYISHQERISSKGELFKYGKEIEVTENTAKILLKQKIGKNNLWEKVGSKRTKKVEEIDQREIEQ